MNSPCQMKVLYYSFSLGAYFPPDCLSIHRVILVPEGTTTSDCSDRLW